MRGDSMCPMGLIILGLIPSNPIVLDESKSEIIMIVHEMKIEKKMRFSMSDFLIYNLL